MLFDFKIFQSVPTPEESLRIQALLGDISHAREAVSLLSASDLSEGFQRMTAFRLNCSHSLRSGATATWIQANQWMAAQIQENSRPKPAWEDLLQLNSILMGLNSGTASVRKHELYLGPWLTCPAKDLDEGLTIFREHVLERTSESPVLDAAWIHYVLVSLHPFHDANGRTSILAADWVLTASDYLPQSFATPLDAVVAHVPGRPTISSPARALEKILNNVLFSYRLVLKEDLEQEQNQKVS